MAGRRCGIRSGALGQGPEDPFHRTRAKRRTDRIRLRQEGLGRVDLNRWILEAGSARPTAFMPSDGHRQRNLEAFGVARQALLPTAVAVVGSRRRALLTEWQIQRETAVQ